MDNAEKCPVCWGEHGGSCKKLDGIIDNAHWFKCEVCGHYGVHRRPCLVLRRPDLSSTLRALLSHQLRTQGTEDDPPVITTPWLADLLKNGKLPSPLVQATNIIRFLGDEESESGGPIEFPIGFHAIIGAPNRDSADQLRNELIEENLVRDVDGYRLTLDGWKRYEEEKRGQVTLLTDDKNTTTDGWDVFICHASEDKDDVVRPLAEALRERECRVWYDDFTLKVGDSLRQSIDRGLAQSRFGVVVLSPNFFAKQWPQNELSGLFSRDVEGPKIILPVWYEIKEAEVRRHSPMLADRKATSWEKGLGQVVEDLMQVINGGSGTALEASPAAGPSFTRMQPKSRVSSFLDEGDTLGTLLAGRGNPADTKIVWHDGPQLFIRVIPDVPVGPYHARQTNQMLETQPLFPFGGRYADSRIMGNEWGTVIFQFRAEPWSPDHIAQVFKKGEIWGIDNWNLRQWNAVPFFENQYADALTQYLQFAREQLGVTSTVTVIAGMSGIQGFKVYLPDPPQGTWRYPDQPVGGSAGPDIVSTIPGVPLEPASEPELEFDENYPFDKDRLSPHAYKTLLPFFENAWGEFQCERPNFLPKAPEAEK